MKTAAGKSIGVLAAAASAASVPTGDQAQAQPQNPIFAVPPGTYFSLEGGVLFSDYGKTTFPGGPAAYLPEQFFDKVPNGPDQSAFSTHRSLGGYGSFTLGQEKPGVDWRYTFSVWGLGKFTGNGTASNSYFGLIDDNTSRGTSNISESQRLFIATMDFDLGKRFNFGGAEIRAFYGLRGIHTQEWIDQFIGTDKTGSDFLPANGSSLTTTNFRSDFSGVGPRAGFEFQSMGTLGFYGTASGAFMLGGRNSGLTSISTFNGSSNGSFLDQQTKFDWVANLSGTLGVFWKFMPNGTLMIGYRADEWFNIHDNFGNFNNGQSKNVLTHSPVLKVTVQY